MSPTHDIFLTNAVTSKIIVKYSLNKLFQWLRIRKHPFIQATDLVIISLFIDLAVVKYCGFLVFSAFIKREIVYL